MKSIKNRFLYNYNIFKEIGKRIHKSGDFLPQLIKNSHNGNPGTGGCMREQKRTDGTTVAKSWVFRINNIKKVNIPRFV